MARSPWRPVWTWTLDSRSPPYARATIDSPGWDRAKDRYNVEIVGGSKSIEIVARPG